MSFHPYLFFSDRKCAEAFRWYHQIFGGELRILTNADAPEGTEQMPGSEPTDVMHAALEIGGHFLMGSDDPTGDGGPKLGVAVSYSASDTKEGQRIFEALCEGGEVQMAWSPQFWTAGFGACVDRYGINWMVDTEEQPA